MEHETEHAAGCEFCVEMQDLEASRFRSIYGSTLASRVVRETAHFIVVPTIGQIVAGAMLVIPREHVETLADVADHTDELLELANECRQIFGENIVFEHGARASTGSGCGVDHAHLHVVPMPVACTLRELLPAAPRVPSVADALRGLKGAREYLMVRDTRGDVSVLDLTNHDGREYPSQYFRRRVVEILKLDAHWDWRRYTAPEENLLRAVEAYGNGDQCVNADQRARMRSRVVASNREA